MSDDKEILQKCDISVASNLLKSKHKAPLDEHIVGEPKKRIAFYLEINMC